uniref:Uncharacterized protein n=1 Tax=Ditylenchus dipsaci TaxID=166011 RepID=A0A915CZE3_9BILA
MGVDLPDLWDYMFSVASFPIKEIPSFPVATSSQDDYIIHPDMSPPRLEELLEDNLLRQKEKEKLGIMEASEFFDPTTVDREQKAKSGFPAFFGRNAQSLGIKVERVGVGPMETMDISLDSLASPIMAIRRPIAKIRKSKLKRKEEKRKKSNIAPITVPPTTMIPPPLIEPSRRVLEIRSEATKLKIILPATPKEMKQVVIAKKDLTSDSDSDIEVVSEVIATPPRTPCIPKEPIAVNKPEETKENKTQESLELKTPCTANNPFRVEPGSGLKLRILRNMPRNE